ncbi:hypothetical protein [Maribellus luteus]|nr:hypothetical protein [Maribellus luteus]
MTRCQLALAGNKLTLTGKALSVLHIILSAVRGRMALLRDVMTPDHKRLPAVNRVLSLFLFY